MRKGRSDTEQSKHAPAFDAEASRPTRPRGTLIAGRYVLERSLGRGGMATVYLAHDQLLDRPVALKMLRHELAHSGAMERFTREIGVVSRLRHAHIVPLHDSGIHEGLPFYVMAFIEGESLLDRIKREHELPAADVARIGTDMAEALAYAHREGVLHRDITPGNILLADSNAYLVDFGIARVFQDADRARTTASGFVLGTPTYMSPEQASGEPDYDGRSDMYSLGCVLYEALTGAPPFKGPTPQAVIASRFGPPPPPCHSVRRDVPPALGEAIARAMAPAPQDRFTDAGELADALAAAVPTEPVPRRVHTLRSRVGRAAALAALVGSAILGVSYVGGSRWIPFRDQLNRIVLTRARGFISAGEWARADTALRALATRDPSNAAAHLWRAQAGALVDAASRDPSGEWKTEASLANEGRTALDTSERVRLDGLIAYARGAHDVARARFTRLVGADPSDVTTRIALADAFLKDSLVEPDARSPSGWRFRGSWEGAARTLLAALDLHPQEPALRRAAYERLTRALATNAARYRPGVAAGSERTFAGFPSLDADTLVYVPYPMADVALGKAEAANTRAQEVVARNRELLKRAAAAWVADVPTSADAHRAYATALASTGDLTPTLPNAAHAIGEIRLARSLSDDMHAQLPIGAQEVRLLLRARHYADARALADSLLARGGEATNADEVETLATLAALTGNASRAAALWGLAATNWHVRLADGRSWIPPSTLGAPTFALEVYGALGGPADSIRAQRERVETVIRRDVPPDMIPVVRTTLLVRPLTLAAPDIGASAIEGVDVGQNQIARMMQHVARADTAALRRGLASVDAMRRSRDAASLAPEGAYLYSWLRLVAGDTSAAERQMDAMLEPMRAATDGMATDLTGTAVLVRLMRLRADVAERRHEPAVGARGGAGGGPVWGGAPTPRRRT
jgi:tRNA A-37 threonylcarbamoyl transferase component Bud32